MSSTIRLGDIPPPCNAPSGGPGGVEGCPTCKRQNWGGKLVVLDVDSWKMGEGGKRSKRGFCLFLCIFFSPPSVQVEKKNSPSPTRFLSLSLARAHTQLNRQPRLPVRPLGLRLLLLLQQLRGLRGLRGPHGQRLHLLRQPEGLRRKLRRLHARQGAPRRQQGQALLQAVRDGAQVGLHPGQQVPVPDVQLQEGRRGGRGRRVGGVDLWLHRGEACGQEIKR